MIVSNSGYVDIGKDDLIEYCEASGLPNREVVYLSFSLDQYGLYTLGM